MLLKNDYKSNPVRIGIKFYTYMIIVLYSYSIQYLIPIQSKLLVNLSHLIRFIFTLLLIVYFLNNFSFLIKIFYNLKKRTKIILSLLFLFVIFMVFQSIILMSARSFLSIPKFLFFIIYIYLVVLIVKQEDFILFYRHHIKTATLLFLIMMMIYAVHLFIGSAHAFRQYRPNIFLGNANEDGGLLASLLPFIIYKYRKRKVLLFVILLIYLFAFYFLNGSRTTLIVSIAIVFILLYHFFKIPSFFRIGFVIIIIYFLLANSIIDKSIDALGLREFQYTSDDIVEMWTNQTGKGQLAGRLAYTWAPMIKYTLKRSPIWGFGNGSWSSITKSSGVSRTLYGSSEMGRSAHNFWVFSIVESGLLGTFLITSAMIGSMLICLAAIRKSKHKEIYDVSLSLLTSWLGFCAWAFAANANSIPGWIILSILIALSLMLTQRLYENPLADK